MKRALLILASVSALAAVAVAPTTASAAGREHTCPSVHSGPLKVMVFADRMTTCGQAHAVARYTINHEAVLPFRVAGQRWQATGAGPAGRGTAEYFRVIGKPNDGAGYGVMLFTNLPVG